MRVCAGISLDRQWENNLSAHKYNSTGWVLRLDGVRTLRVEVHLVIGKDKYCSFCHNDERFI